LKVCVLPFNFKPNHSFLNGNNNKITAIKDLEDISEPLSKLPPFLWKLMIQWFFDFP